MIPHLFNWANSKQTPTEEDVICLLNTKFNLRLDLSRRLVEFASPVRDDMGDEAGDETEGSSSKKVKRQ